MSAALAQQSWYMTVRRLRALWRQPWYVAITLVQPVFWLLLFGALFQKIVDIPGFETTDYYDYLTPGVVVMTAVFSAGWSGMAILEDLDRGVMDRFLVSPVQRGSLISGILGQLAIVIVIQSLVVIGLGAAVGASYPGGPLGVVVAIVASTFLAWAFGALSCGLALVARQEETLIGVVQFVVLPLTFLSSAFMQQSLMPGWIQDIARFNPVNWAIQSGREALGADVDWGLVLSRLGYLAAFALVCAWIAARAFRAYQKSV